MGTPLLLLHSTTAAAAERILREGVLCSGTAGGLLHQTPGAGRRVRGAFFNVVSASMLRGPVGRESLPANMWGDALVALDAAAVLKWCALGRGREARLYRCNGCSHDGSPPVWTSRASQDASDASDASEGLRSALTPLVSGAGTRASAFTLSHELVVFAREPVPPRFFRVAACRNKRSPGLPSFLRLFRKPWPAVRLSDLAPAMRVP